MKNLFLIIAILAIALTAAPALATDVTLSWTKPDDARVTGYNIYVDPVLVDIGSDIDATVTDLTDGLTYYFGATSFDAEGVESPMSDIIKYTVQPASKVIEIPGPPERYANGRT